MSKSLQSQFPKLAETMASVLAPPQSLSKEQQETQARLIARNKLAAQEALLRISTVLAGQSSKISISSKGYKK